MDLKVVRFDQNHRSCVRVSTQSPNPILRQSPLFQPLVFARVILIVCNPVKSGTKWKKTGYGFTTLLQQSLLHGISSSETNRKKPTYGQISKSRIKSV